MLVPPLPTVGGDKAYYIIQAQSELKEAQAQAKKLAYAQNFATQENSHISTSTVTDSAVEEWLHLEIQIPKYVGTST
jgi:type VI protein secretion system component Hcp